MRNRYFGIELGFVRDVKDPEKRGRVRIYVPAIFPEDRGGESWLDWALPMSGSATDVPPVNSAVFVMFERGYITNPIYSPGWTPGTDAQTSEAPPAARGELEPTWTQERKVASAGRGPAISVTIPADTARETRPKYPDNHVFTYPGGHILEIDASAGKPRARYQHPTGTCLLIDADGSVHIRSKGAQFFEPEGDFVVALKEGARFSVAYPGGGGLTVGQDGVHAAGHQASILGRNVTKNGEDI
jgi:hypothetical protein